MTSEEEKEEEEKRSDVRRRTSRRRGAITIKTNRFLKEFLTAYQLHQLKRKK